MSATTSHDLRATPVSAPAPASGAAARRASAPATAVGIELRRMLGAGELDLPLPGGGSTERRWAALAAWGGRDLSLARLAEGHVDALAILAEAGRAPVPDALYGVWASRAGGTAVRVEREGGTRVLRGTLRFCSGARTIDRALVVADVPVADASPARLLLDVPVRGPEVEQLPDSWCTPAMAGADTLDVVFHGLRVDVDDEVGEPGWYVARPGFALGGGGVGAVWWGGAAGVLDRALAHLGAAPDRHALAHVGELHAALAASDALARHTAAGIDADRGPEATPGPSTPVPSTPVPSTPEPSAPGSSTPGDPPPDVTLAVATFRAAVERAAREVVDRVPRIVGPGPLSRDADLAGALADLALYVRQHHGERDHAALGERVVDRRRTA